MRGFDLVCVLEDGGRGCMKLIIFKLNQFYQSAYTSVSHCPVW